MKVHLDRDIVDSNLAKVDAKFSSQGVEVAIMAKEFYSELLMKTTLRDGAVWGVGMGQYNYVIGKNTIYHKGGIISVREAEHLSRECLGRKQSFEAYLPVNLLDDREGYEVRELVQIISKIKALENDYFKLVGACITSGCLHGNTPSFKELSEVTDILYYLGLEKISIGGSFYVGWKKLPKRVTQIRVGEFILYGTIPYSKSGFRGKPAITVTAEIIEIYPSRKHLLVDIGVAKYNPKESKVFSKGLEFVQASTEYTIFKYSKDYKVGQHIVIQPDYYSLIKLR